VSIVAFKTLNVSQGSAVVVSCNTIKVWWDHYCRFSPDSGRENFENRLIFGTVKAYNKICQIFLGHRHKVVTQLLPRVGFEPTTC